jgi:hypothetical protein
MNKLSIKDFAASFGTTEDDIRENCLEIINSVDFNYSIIDGSARDKLILDILKRIDADQQVIGAPKRQQVWDKGWGENLKGFVSSDYDLNELIPKFIRPNQPIRFNLNYIQPSNPNFELDFFSVFRLWLFKKYFSDYSHVYEFGCGTGFNLVALAQQYPDKELYGLDFVPSSVELVNQVGDHHSYNISGHLFDMISPDASFALEKNSAMFTIGSIEQLAGKFESFVEYILKQPVSLCVHVEPTIELYDENILVDYLAIKFQGKRGYTDNFLPYLKKLESDKVVEILKVKRLFFGSLFLEGYNCIIWRPTNK